MPQRVKPLSSFPLRIKECFSPCLLSVTRNCVLLASWKSQSSSYETSTIIKWGNACSFFMQVNISRLTLKQQGFLMHIHISDLNAKSSLTVGKKMGSLCVILHFLRSHGALDNLTCLGELLLDTWCFHYDYITVSGKLDWISSLALWCLVKY